jgi:hypothetical protein
MALQPFLLDLGRFFSFFIPYTFGRTPWMEISPSQGRYLHTGQHKHRINAHRYPCLEWGLEPTIPVFEGTKTVRVLDRAATVIGSRSSRRYYLMLKLSRFHKLLQVRAYSYSSYAYRVRFLILQRHICKPRRLIVSFLARLTFCITSRIILLHRTS